MNYIELFINDPINAKLDINQNVDIALQYSIADIKDISKRNAAYSKTIILPGTKNNNYWFGNLFDVNADFTMFNPNKKTLAKLVVNTEIVIDGFLQLRKISKLNNVDGQGNLVNYEVVIYNNAVDLMSVLGEKSINTLDMSQFGHTFSNTNIKNSWDNTWEDGYVYPMYGLNNGANNYKVEYFYPGIYYKSILDQMIREAGFGWTGSLYTNTQFEKEIISYVTDGRPKIDEAETERRKFYVGRTQSINLAIGNWQDANLNVPTFIPPFPSQGAGGVNAQLNDETQPPFFDNDNHWNTSLYEWTLDKNGRFSCQGGVRMRLQFYNSNPSFPAFAYWVVPGGSSGVFAATSSGRFTLQARVQIFDSSLNTWNGPNSTWAYAAADVIMPSGLIAASTMSSPIITLNFNGDERELTLGSKVRVSVNVVKSSANPTLVYSGTGAPVGVDVSLRLLATASNGQFANWFRNVPVAAEFTQNEFIDLARYLPDKVKQKDLLTDLIRRYNLFIQTDPANPKKLIFDTRPDFYDRGGILDWTNKKDYGQADEIELLSDLQFKQMIWQYKPDSDDINKNYTEITGDTYGQYEYFFDNDFVKGESKIESSFSPSPLVKTAFDAIVPAINPQLPKVQPRIFYWGGMRDCDGWFWTYQTPTGLTGASESFSQYPYAGHFDDPIQPEIDINFGGNKFYFYDDWEYITDNNMFNTYWSDYVRQIETGRLVTSYFYLDEYDVRYIKDNFYTKIFVLDSYYYVNKIIDYKPLENGTTKVELIKIVDGIRWEPRRTTANVRPKPANPLTVLNEVVVGVGNSTGGGGGILVGSGNVVGGKVSKLTPQGMTFTGPQKNMTIGDFNSNYGENSFIVGDLNSVNSDNTIILGGNNNFIEASNTTLINASGIIATQSDRIYLGNFFTIDINSGSFSTPFFSSASASSLGLTGGNTNSVPVWYSINGLTNSNITDNGVTISFGGRDTVFNTTVILNNTNGNNQFWNLGVESDGAGQIGRMAPNKYNAVLFGAGSGTINNASGYTHYLCGGTGSGRKVNLPSYGISEWDFVISDYGGSASSAPIEIAPAAGETINGSTYSFWIDQNYGLIHIYSDNRTGWVVDSRSSGATASSIVNGKISIPGGTRTELPFYFENDTDTGLFRNTTNQLSIVAGGGTASTFGSGQNTMHKLTYFNNDLVLYSPDGTPWQVSITNTGTFTASALA